MDALILVFLVAVALNLVWEMLQFPLYTCSEEGHRRVLRCLVASLGDGVMLLLILLVGWTVFGTVRWFVDMNREELALIGASGLVLALVAELAAVYRFERWAYSERMPMIPGVGIGWLPVLQMLVLPPLIFWIAGRIL